MKIAIFACFLALAGCATNAPSRSYNASVFHETVPVCTGEAECKVMWEAAQIWVAQHSRMKIQTATDVLIETYGGGANSATLAMRVLKVPQGGGVYRIEFDGGCNNIFGCVPDKFEVGVAFNQAVAAAKP